MGPVWKQPRRANALSRTLATLCLVAAVAGCGDVDLAREQPPLVAVITPTSYKQPAPKVEPPPRVPTKVEPDWAGFTRYIGTLRAWWAPSPRPKAQARAVPVPPRAPTSTSGCWSELYAKAGWPAYTHAWLARTIRGESGCRPGAYNPTPCARGAHALGLLQLCSSHASWLHGNFYDAFDNLRMGWQLCLVQPTAWSWHGRCR